jgi:AbrB family looped-hinge helix DNA binding protein
MAKYSVKISEQGQITLPKSLRQQLNTGAGARVVLVVDDNTPNNIKVTNEYPIKAYFGTMGNSITNGTDATEFIKNMRQQDTNKRLKH